MQNRKSTPTLLVSKPKSLHERVVYFEETKETNSSPFLMSNSLPFSQTDIPYNKERFIIEKKQEVIS